MKSVCWLCAAALTVLAAPSAYAQEIPKPGPEHEVLKKLAGMWDLTMSAGGMESKGTVTYKMDLGGLWLVSSLEAELGGMKFQGRGMDTYDTKKKKYVSYWFDSMAATPMVMEGTYDEKKKSMTMVGDGPGMDGKITKWRSVSEMPDNDTHHFKMYVGDAKEPMFSITYKRKK